MNTHSECKFFACLKVHCWLTFPVYCTSFLSGLLTLHSCHSVNVCVCVFERERESILEWASPGLSHLLHLAATVAITGTVSWESHCASIPTSSRPLDPMQLCWARKKKTTGSVRWITSEETGNCVCVCVFLSSILFHVSIFWCYMFMWPTDKSDLVQSVSLPSDRLDMMTLFVELISIHRHVFATAKKKPAWCIAEKHWL